MIMKNYVIDLLIENLENYEDVKVYGSELHYTLLDGSITYNTYEASMWIKNYWDEIGDILEDIDFELGSDYTSKVALDMFRNPKRAVVAIVFEVASDIISDLDFCKEYWNDEVILTDKNIKIIKKELEELKG